MISVSCLLTWNFNSRPHGGRRRDFYQLLTDLEFQLTPSRRATTHSGRSRSRSCNFNSRPHGGRPVHCPFSSGVLISTHALTEGDVTGKGQRYFVNISTHALTEGDMFLLYNLVMEVIFQLTPSRRATSSVMNTCSHFGISTHALTEGDE